MENKEPFYKKVGHALIKSADYIINFAVLVFIVLVFLFGVFSIWDNNNIEKQGDSEQYQMYKPTVEDTVTFEELQRINPDIFGWLTIDDTKIDYPLVQGKDNDIYINTAPDGSFALTGSIFLDYRNSKDFTDFNSIIYGHHVEHEMMFGGLDRFEEKAYFDSHRYGALFFNGKQYRLEIYAVISANAYDNTIFAPKTEESRRSDYLEYIKVNSINFREIGVTADEHIIILSTCSSDTTNGRKLLVMRIGNEIGKATQTTDTQTSTEEEIIIEEEETVSENHNLIWLILAVLVWIVLILVIILILTKKREKKMKKNQDPKNSIEETTQEQIQPITQNPPKAKPVPLWKDLLRLFIKIGLILLALYLLFTFVFGIHINSGVAMSPSINERDIVIYYRFDNSFKADETVVYEYSGETFVGRVVAVEGDTVEVTENGLKINGYLQQEKKSVGETLAFENGVTYPVTLKKGEVFIIGDNREKSKDSRLFGAVSQKQIQGSIITIIRRRDI